MRRRSMQALAGTVLVLIVIVGVVLVSRHVDRGNRIHVVGYFANSTGVFVGDDVRILGIPVGKIEQIEPRGDHVEIRFWFDGTNKVPAEAKAVVLSPALVPARAIQLTPAYTGGPAMADGAVIPLARTAVPMEWDDFRKQLQRLTNMLEPTQPGGVSTLGAYINTAADNLRGQGTNIRQALSELSQAVSALGDHSQDIFGTVKSLSILVSALKDSTGIIRSLNENLAGVTEMLSSSPNAIGNAVRDVNAVVGDVQQFVAANRETLGTTSDKTASITTALVQSLDDLKQTLHIAPNTVQNFDNIYHPAQGGLTGAAVVNTFANPITFLCGAIQAASRLNAEQSAKLCAQYLAPIVKNRQYNFPPLGFNMVAGATARPNELTYSEDWLRPDHVPTQPVPTAAAAAGPGTPAGPPLLAEAPTAASESRETDPSNGLRGMMAPAGGGS